MLSALTIAQAHDKLKAKEITAVELTQACLDRIDQTDDQLNAVVHNHGDHALEQAKAVDKAGKFEHALTGIPYLAKDNYNEKGLPTTAASNILREKDYLPPYDATTIMRLKQKGAISLGKGNTDEFTMGSSTEYSCYETTCNPYDTSRVAGGSSGGPAASLCADQCLFSLGTDTCGSIRLPAAFCNSVGVRPTYGRTSRYGVMSMASSLDTIGPMTKTVEDTAIVLEAISGADPFDRTTKDTKVPNYQQALKKDLKGMKLGLPKEYFGEGLNPECEKLVREAVKVCEDLGAKVEEVSLPLTKYGIPTYYIICPSEVSSNMARYDGIRFGHHEGDQDLLIEYYHAVRTAGFGDEVKRRIMIGTYALSAGYYDAYYRQALKVRALIKQEFEQVFTKVDAIIGPVSSGTAFTIGAHEGDPVAMYLEDIFLAPQVMAGIPCLSVPAGFSAEGLPIGLQVMGPQWGEEGILKVAYAYEQATKWYERRPEL